MNVRRSASGRTDARPTGPVLIECLNTTTSGGPIISEWAVKFFYGDIDDEFLISPTSSIEPGQFATLISTRKSFCTGYIAYAKWEWSGQSYVSSVRLSQPEYPFVRASSICLGTTHFRDIKTRAQDEPSFSLTIGP